eukprot:3109793-Rhodomonas_salina.1
MVLPGPGLRPSASPYPVAGTHPKINSKKNIPSTQFTGDAFYHRAQAALSAYAKCGTDLAYGATRPILLPPEPRRPSPHHSARLGICLRGCYGVCGTDMANGATRRAGGEHVTCGPVAPYATPVPDMA